MKNIFEMISEIKTTVVGEVESFTASDNFKYKQPYI